MVRDPHRDSPLHRYWLSLLIFLGTGTLGCSGPALEPSSTAGDRASRNSRTAQSGRPTFTLEGLQTADLCLSTTPIQTDKRLHLHLFITTGTSTELAQTAVNSARIVWERLGLTIDQPHTTLLGPDIPTRVFDAEAADDAQRLAPLQKILRAVKPAPETIPVVVLDGFVDTPSALSKLRGLTVPGKNQTLDSNVPQTVWDALDRPAFPVILLDAAAGPRAPGDLTLTPAHELGHALGLSHRSADEALMSSGDLSLRCIPGLTPGEWSVILPDP